MENFIKDITDYYWWISVVVVGIIINIAATFIKERFDKSIKTYSTKQKIKLEEELKREGKRVDEISKSEFKLVMQNLQEFRYRLWAISFLLVGIMSLLFAIFINNFFSQYNFTEHWRLINKILTIGLLIMGGISFTLVMKAHSIAVKDRKVLFKAFENWVEKDN